jgi:hypothetical protein
MPSITIPTVPERSPYTDIQKKGVHGRTLTNE